MDPLVQIPKKQWPCVQEEMKNMWPLNIAGYYILHFNLKYPNISEALQFKLYCPYGDISSGFVCTTFKGKLECIVFSASKNTWLLDEALRTTKLIDWRKVTQIDVVNSLVLNTVENIIIPSLDATYRNVKRIKFYFMDRNTRPFPIRCPPYTYVAPLNRQHAQRVDDTWPYKHAGSYSYYSTLLENNLGLGLFSTDNDQLLAWILLNEYNYLRHLYCEKEHRNKGYGEFILKCMINYQLAQGNDAYACVVYENTNSCKLFEKIGFINTDVGGYVSGHK